MPGFLNPFRSDRVSRKSREKREFVAPRHVEDNWKIYRKGVYVDKPRRQAPGWLIPLLAFLLIMALVFWLVPTVIFRLQTADRIRQEIELEPVETLYGENIWVVGAPVADVFGDADLKARRITQVLYNEPVRVLPQNSTFGFVHVELSDGSRGFLLQDHLTDQRSSVEPGHFSYKLVVSAPTKRIMSHASRGTLVAEIMMGSIIFADYQGDSIFRVKLPDGQQGWVSADGLIVLEPEERITVLPDGVRYFTNSALAFHRVTYLENGQSILGVSTPGIARIAAMVNGIDLPRSLVDQSRAGFPVMLTFDQETGALNLDSFAAGDLIFLHDSQNPDQPADMAICIGGNQILYARSGDTSIRLYDMTQQPDIVQRIVSARRIFN